MSDIENGISINKGYRLVREVKSERMQFLIRPTTKEALSAIAKDAEISVNELVNRILEESICESRN